MDRARYGNDVVSIRHGEVLLGNTLPIQLRENHFDAE